MAEQRLQRERARAQRRIRALQRRLDGVICSAGWSVQDDEHDPEGATVAFERAQITGLLDAARRDLAAIDRALDRVRAGIYAACERCGGPIGRERLDALPAAATCSRCARS